jgi:hypothetical protein
MKKRAYQVPHLIINILKYIIYANQRLEIQLCSSLRLPTACRLSFSGGASGYAQAGL